MVADASADQPAHIQQVEFVAGRQCVWNVPDEALERAPVSQNPSDNVTRVYLGHSPGYELERAIGRILGQGLDHDYVPGLRPVLGGPLCSHEQFVLESKIDGCRRSFIYAGY